MPNPFSPDSFFIQQHEAGRANGTNCVISGREGACDY